MTKRSIRSSSLYDPVGPFSHAVRLGIAVQRHAHEHLIRHRWYASPDGGRGWARSDFPSRGHGLDPRFPLQQTFPREERAENWQQTFGQLGCGFGPAQLAPSPPGSALWGTARATSNRRAAGGPR